MSDRLRANADLVDSLSSAARHGGSALADTPALLRRVLEEDAWREFTTQRGEHVEHRRFSEFVTARPLRGLGVEMPLIERIVRDDPALLVMLREADKVGRGRRTDLEPAIESVGSDSTNSTPAVAARLARDAPDQYERVLRGELTVHAAAIEAGIRKRRFSVRADDMESTARSLRAHLTPGQLAELRELL